MGNGLIKFNVVCKLLFKLFTNFTYKQEIRIHKVDYKKLMDWAAVCTKANLPLNLMICLFCHSESWITCLKNMSGNQFVPQNLVLINIATDWSIFANYMKASLFQVWSLKIFELATFSHPDPADTKWNKISLVTRQNMLLGSRILSNVIIMQPHDTLLH